MLSEIPATLWPGVLKRALPDAPDSRRAWLAALLPEVLASGIDTPLRLAHWLAQIGHESGQLRHLVEVWGPTPAQRRYEGRRDLGNTEPGDGKRFRGRGLIQLTGRANYAAFGAAAGRDLLADPAAVATEPALAVGAALWFWHRNELNRAADRDDMHAVTRAINGGSNGLTDRARLLGLARAGIDWGQVTALQLALNAAAAAPPLAVDGSHGPLTDRALRAFQDRCGLPADGLPGPATWAALRRHG